MLIDDFPKIDAHIHFNSGRKTVLDLAASYDFSLLTINTEVPEFPSINKQQELAEQYRDASATRLFYATTISTEDVFADGWAQQAIEKIKRDRSRGACGVKFWKNIGMSIQRPNGSFLMLDDPELRPVFNFLEQKQIPVLGHQGEPKNCWLPVKEMTVKSDRDYFSAHPQYHMYKHDEYPDYWKHIEARDHILQLYPTLHFVGLHLASMEWNLDEIAKRLDKYPHMAVDLAERITHLYDHASRNRKKVTNFFEKYQDRIIYGTDIIDGPEQDPADITKELKHRWETHWRFFSTDKQLTSEQVGSPFRGLHLTESIIRKIYRENAINWYQLADF